MCIRDRDYSYADKTFTKLTTPKLLCDGGYATIEADINFLKSDGLYHMLIKKEEMCIRDRIKPHVPPLVRAPVNSFEFHRCRRTPQVGCLMLSLGR